MGDMGMPARQSGRAGNRKERGFGHGFVGIDGCGAFGEDKGRGSYGDGSGSGSFEENKGEGWGVSVLYHGG